MTVILRNYQLKIIEQIRDFIKSGEKRILVQSATGSGKTKIAAYIIKAAAEKNKVCWFIVHKRKLIEQTSASFSAEQIDHGIIWAEREFNPEKLVQVCSIQTLSTGKRNPPKPDIILYDECHHNQSKTWSKIQEDNPQAIHIGLTATPRPTNGAGLKKQFNVMVKGPEPEWLIENGHLVPYTLYRPGNVDMSKVRISMGDYALDDLLNLLSKPHIIGETVAHYQGSPAYGKPCVVFCLNIDDSKKQAMAFLNAGISAEHIDGTMKMTDLNAVFQRFESGGTKVICNADLIGEGVDVPAISVIIIRKPTRSIIRWLQWIGRGLRKSPGKDRCYIYDTVGNVMRHGYPDDIQEWSVDGVAKKKGKNLINVKECPNCFACWRSTVKQCNECNHVFTSTAQRATIKEVTGELVADKFEDRKNQERMKQGTAKTLESLIALGRSRGMKSPAAWAKHVISSRSKKNGNKNTRFSR